MTKENPEGFSWLEAKIKENYFNCNFGTLSKSDFELFIFKTFIDIKSKELAAGETLDYFELSKELGITEARFNNLVQKLSLRKLYSEAENEKDWKSKFINLLENIKFDSKNCRFKLLITDPVIKAEFKHHIESKNWFDDGSFNSKVIIMQPECLLAVLVDFMDKEKDEEKRLNLDSICDEKTRTAIKDCLSANASNTDLIDSIQTCTVNFICNKLGLTDFSAVFNILLDSIKRKFPNSSEVISKIKESTVGK